MPHFDSTQPALSMIAGWSFDLTWQHLLRTLAVAIIGVEILVFASQVRAEGGDANGVVSPDQAQEFLNAAAAEAASPAEEEAPEPEIKPAAKAAKGAEARKARRVAAATGKAHEAGAAQAAEDDANETASLPSIDARAKLRPSDAVRAGALKVLIVRYASENGLPYELADAVVRLESRYNPGARNGTHMGLTQINVRTAQSLGYAGPAAGLLDAETNLRYGLKYLAKAYKLAGGDTCGTILRYQFGHRTQTMTSASRAYCAKVKVITAAAD